LACLLCASLVSTSVAPCAFAAANASAKAKTQAPQPQAAMQFFRDKKVLVGDDDPFSYYLYDKKTGELTDVGKVLYRYFKDNESQIPHYSEAFKDIRKQSGGYTEDKQKSVRQAIKAVEDRFGGIENADSEDAFDLGTKVQAILQGLQASNASSKNLLQTEDATGISLRDAEGTVVRFAKVMVCTDDRRPKEEPVRLSVEEHAALLDAGRASGEAAHLSCHAEGGAQTFSRELQGQQRKMNSARQPCAPEIPETGRYNYETLYYDYCERETQVKAQETGLKLDRLMRLAQYLGEQYREDQYLREKDLERALVEKGRAKKLGIRDSVCGEEVYDYVDLVDCRLKKRKGYLEEARALLNDYKRRVESFSRKDIIRAGDINGLRADSNSVYKQILLATTQSQVFAARNQMEGIGWESENMAGGPVLRRIQDAPDAAQMSKALQESPLSDDEKRRYWRSGEDLARRMQKLISGLKRLEDAAVDTDPATGMSSLFAGLQSVQGQLADVGLDYMLFASLPALSKIAGEEGSGVTPWVTQKGAELLKGMPSWLGGNGAKRYLKDRELIGSLAKGNGSGYADKLVAMARLVAAGDFKGARKALLEMDPDAILTHRDIGMQGDSDFTEPQKLQASLRKAQDVMLRVSNVHVWTGMVINTVIWSAGLAIAAPIASAALSGAARGLYAAANLLSQGTGSVKLLATGIHVAGAVAENMALRLATLSPAMDKLYATNTLARWAEANAVRFVNAGVRMSAYSFGLSGGIGGVMTAGTHVYKEARSGHSPFASTGEAFKLGYQNSAKWASSSWHPLLLYGGIPSNAFESTFLAPAAESLATRGLFGNMSAVAESGLKTMGMERAAQALNGFGLQSLMKQGGWGVGAATALSMGDNIAKYMAFSQGIGAASKMGSWRYNELDGDNVERRIKRAEQANMRAMEAPYWLFLPTYPARYEAQAKDMRNSQKGYEDYKKAGELDKIANAAADVSVLQLKSEPGTSYMEKIFNFRWRGQSGEHGTFKVNKQMKYDAIREELPLSLGEKGMGIGVNPMRYYEVSQMKDGKAVGRLIVSDEVRDQAQALFEQAILNNSQLSSNILSAKLGAKLDGFGVVRLNHQEEVARILYRANESGRSVPKAQLEAGKALLKPYLDSENMVLDKAAKLTKALAENKTPSKAFQNAVETLMGRTVEWKNEQAANPRGAKHYTELFSEFRKQADVEGLSPQEKAVLVKTVDYLEAIEGRFHYFNRTETFTARVKDSLGALRTEYDARPNPNPEVRTALESILKQTLDWTAKNRGAGEQVLRPTENPKAAMPSDFNGLVKDLSVKLDSFKGKLSPADYKIVEAAVKEVQAGPWMLHDSKGTNLQGWRPEQFEGLMYFLSAVAKDGTRSSDIVRTFLQMKTGAGKTLIAYEGLLPFAEADAAQRGKKTMFLTVQSNLESQARIEFRSLKKLATKMTIDTYEGFKTKIAEGKLRVKSVADDYWILGDEMDGAAMQPALTIGETTAQVSKERLGYRMLKEMGKRMMDEINRAPQESFKQAQAQIQRLQSAAEDLPEGPAKTAALKDITEIRHSARDLMFMETKGFLPSADKGQALQRARGWLRREGGNALPASEAESLQKLVADLEQAPGKAPGAALLNLDAKLKDLHAGLLQKDVARFEGRIQTLVARQSGRLEGVAEADSVRPALKSAGEDLLQALSNRHTAAISDISSVRMAFDKMLLSQRSILAQSESAGESAAKHLEKLASAARKEGRIEDAQSMLAQAKTLREDSVQARLFMKENEAGLRQVLKEGKEGWEGSVRELIVRRESVVDRTVAKENPIYQTFARMRQDMIPMVRSSLRMQDDGIVLQESPQKAGQALRKYGEKFLQAMESLAGKDPSSQSLAAKARELKTKWDQKATELSVMLDKPLDAKHQEAMEARKSAYDGLSTAEEALRTVRTEYDAADAAAKPVIKERVDGAKGVVESWNVKVADANRQLSTFQAAQRELVRAELQGLNTEIKQAAVEWNTQLSALKTPEAQSARTAMSGLSNDVGMQTRRLAMDAETAGRIWQRRIDGVSTPELAARYALQWTGLRTVLSNIPALKEKPFFQPITQTTQGLTRVYARELIKNFLMDDFLPPDVRWRMFWQILPSAVFPRGVAGKGSGWVRNELFNLARGFFDNPANIRVDNITGKVNVIHNGQWFESMDTPTRRFWELEYGTDLTLPYEHKTMVTMNDLIKDNRNVRFVGFSGTTGEKFTSYLGENAVEIAGKGSQSNQAGLDLYSSPAGRFKAIGDAVLKANEDPQALVVLSLSDTRMVNAVRDYLIKTGKLKAENIAKVFSDSEFLRLGRPKADVGPQMNLDEGLTKGKVKVLMLDTRVGGRGLDLNFKGDRTNPSADAFKGYKNFQMLIVDPQEMSGVHGIQAQGRIDLGRVLPGAERSFKLVMDIKSAELNPVFQKMLREEPIFQQLRQSPEVLRMSSEKGMLAPDWQTVNEYVQSLEARQASPELTRIYRQTVDKYLTLRQNEVELEQLRSSAVLKDATKYQDPRYRALDGH
jgi:hypothetical protein